MANSRYSTAIVAAIVLSASAGASAAQNLKAPGQQPLVATSAMLGIKSPTSNACPNQAKMTGWIKTNKPGSVSYMLAREGGSVSGPYQVNAVPSAQGAMATFSRNIPIVAAIDTKYRLLVADGTGKVMSNWVPLKASCKIKLGG